MFFVCYCPARYVAPCNEKQKTSYNPAYMIWESIPIMSIGSEWSLWRFEWSPGGFLPSAPSPTILTWLILVAGFSLGGGGGVGVLHVEEKKTTKTPSAPEKNKQIFGSICGKPKKAWEEREPVRVPSTVHECVFSIYAAGTILRQPAVSSVERRRKWKNTENCIAVLQLVWYFLLWQIGEHQKKWNQPYIMKAPEVWYLVLL